MNKKVLTLSLIFLISFLATGCSNSQQDEITRLNKSYGIEQQKNVELETEKDVANKKLESLNKKLEKQVSIITTLTSNSAHGMYIYPIYSADPDTYYNHATDTYNTEIDCYINMSEDDSLKSKLDTIAETISESHFGNLPIKVLGIDNQKIATIDLEEAPEQSTNTSMPTSSSWATGYFQGSTGGTITTISLTESFLQKDYKGEWIDGIRFLYKGQPIDFQHVPTLSKVIYRS